MPELVDAVIEIVGSEEGWREFLYDDATGKSLAKGSTIAGFPTIGWGFRVDPGGEPMPRQVGDLWRRLIVEKRVEALALRWKPFAAQPEDVRLALVAMSFQMGVDGVMSFGMMLAALERGDRETAAANVTSTTSRPSKFWTETPARAERIADLIRGERGEPT